MRTYLFPTEILKVTFVFFILTVILSCSKDSDLLAEYVMGDSLEATNFHGIIVDDQFVTSHSKSIILDVLSNDAFANLDNVKIVETSTAKSGRIVINDDNTLTYTPGTSLSVETIETTETETPQTPSTEVSPIAPPSIEIPIEETPITTETPSTETPSTEIPTTEIPTTETPVAETPVTETPTTEIPTTETPTLETPSNETSETETSEDSIPEPPVDEPKEDSSNEDVTDTFTYTVEEESEDGTVSSEEGTVTITITNDSNNHEEDENDSSNILTYKNAFYVTPSGQATNDGKSEAKAWSLAHAINRAEPGDTVLIKSGVYEQSTLEFRKNGSPNAPIVFIGYTLEPGDISSVKHGTMDYGDDINNIGFPIINPTEKKAVYIAGEYTELHNIGFYDNFKDASYCVLIDGNHNILDNIAFADFGPKDNTYIGAGVHVRGNNNTIRNSYGENCDGEGFIIHPNVDGTGNNNVFENNEYYSDNLSKMTDYFFTTSYKGSDLNTASGNIFKGNRGYRMHNGSHKGHGLANGGGSNNLWLNNLVHRTKIEIRYPSSTGTIYDGNIVTGDVDGGVSVEQGATNIEIKNGYYECDYIALGFIVKKYNPIVSTKSPSNIKVHNNIFKGGERMINMGAGTEETSPCQNIEVYNNIFDGQTGGIRYYNNGNEMAFKNNIVVNSTSSKWATVDSGSLAIVAENNLFYNNSFKTPTSGFSRTITENPLFKGSGSVTEKYKLQAGSPAINAGVPYAHRTSDFDGRPISGNQDIGPYEN